MATCGAAPRESNPANLSAELQEDNFQQCLVYIKAHVGSSSISQLCILVIMFSKGYLAALTTLTLAAAVNADGLYSKGSAVLQVDGKSYNKLVAKSNLVSVSFSLRMYYLTILNTDNVIQIVE